MSCWHAWQMLAPCTWALTGCWRCFLAQDTLSVWGTAAGRAASADLVGKSDEPKQRCGRQCLEGGLQGTPDQLQVIFTAAEVHQGKGDCLAGHLWDAAWVLQVRTPPQRCGLVARDPGGGWTAWCAALQIQPLQHSPCNTAPCGSATALGAGGLAEAASFPPLLLGGRGPPRRTHAALAGCHADQHGNTCGHAYHGLTANCALRAAATGHSLLNGVRA